MKTKIPAAIIGLLSQILPDNYTHDGINGLFLTASAPDEIPEGSKSSKVTTWLRAINNESADPITVLGNIIEDFMDKETYAGNFWTQGDLDDHQIKLKQAQEKIIQTLAKDGFAYSRGGFIAKGGASPTQSLKDEVEQKGLAAIDIEITRALGNVDKDPLAAIHNAGSVIEAALKSYMDKCGIAYNEDKDKLDGLWDKFVEHIGIHPKGLSDNDLKKIASGLFSIVQGTMNLRNKKSAAHGKSDSQFKQHYIKPRHARLAIHAAHTISVYIIEMSDSSNVTDK